MANYMLKASGTFAGGAFWSFGLNATGSISEATAESVWNTATVAFFATTAVAALYSTGTILTGTSASTASSTWRQVTITRTTASTAGTATTQELPISEALLITTRTASADKSGHGRLYLPPPVAAALSVGSGGHVSTGSSTTLATALTVWRTALTTGGLTPILLARRATVGGLPADNVRAITGWELVHTLATQKRRGDKLVPLRTTF